MKPAANVVKRQNTIRPLAPQRDASRGRCQFVVIRYTEDVGGSSPSAFSTGVPEASDLIDVSATRGRLPEF